MKNKSGIILWVSIVISAVFIIGVLTAAIVLPSRLYYFCGTLIHSSVHPVWCILSVIAFIVQTVRTELKVQNRKPFL